jgi:signal transduction histidine kinase
LASSTPAGSFGSLSWLAAGPPSDGPGVPAEARDIVFERFVRVDTARTRDTGGTGLGLAIVADVVASHHGSITVTDSDPHGATFTVELPAHEPT